MKIFLPLFLGLALSLTPIAKAELPGGFAEGSQDLLSALTLCPSPNNPLTDGLQAVGGNLFADVLSTTKDHELGFVTIRAKLVSSLHARNLAIMAPDRIVGSLELKMGYEHTSNHDRPLVCHLTVTKKVPVSF